MTPPRLLPALLVSLAACFHGLRGEETPAARHLFLDPALLTASHGVRLAVNPPQRMETVIVPDRPWEQLMISFFLTVRQEGGRLRMWYLCRDRSDVPNLAYAESTDGIHWTKPNLGIADYHGSRENNLVGVASGEGVVFVDPNAPPDARYGFLTNSARGILRLTSPDGLHWKKQPEPLLPFLSDTQNDLFWDSRLGRYVLYLRGWDPAPRRRKVVRATMESLDRPLPIRPDGRDMVSSGKARHLPFINDELPTVLHCDEEDPDRTDIYNIGAEPYALDPAWYVGFPTFLRRSPETDAPGYHGASQGPAEVQFVGSTDGIAWNRYDRAPYAAPGNFGHESEQMAFMGVGLIVKNNEIWQYGTVFRTRHGDMAARMRRTDGAIVRYRQRIDGFVALTADGEGSCTTVPVRAEGARLVLNFDTGALGEVQVGLRDANGAPIPGYSVSDCATLQGDSLGTAVSWEGHTVLPALANGEVSLEFRLRRARVFSFRFESSPGPE